MSELESRFREHSVAELFSRRVRQHPFAKAITCGPQTITYEELNIRSDRWARILGKLGARPEVHVGLLIPRSIDAITAMLGIAKAGAVCVPLDCSHPGDRIRATLLDANCRILLTAVSSPEHSGDWVVLQAESFCAVPEQEDTRAGPREGAVLPQNLLYVIYTSGSSGRPKGVQVTHANILSLASSALELEPFDVGDVWTHVHSLAFDLSVWETWVCLLTGGELVIVPSDVARSPASFLDLLGRFHVSVLSLTPLALGELLSHSAEALSTLPLRMLTVGGERLPRNLAQSIVEEGLPIWNFYGPTECSVWATAHRLHPAHLGGDEVPVGSPLSNSQVHVLDENLSAVPIDVVGELCIGGEGLARGYLGRPALTAERFVPDPFGKTPGSRLYRTGDRARYRADGALEVLGRKDQQIKLRGYRIEPGEIEAALMRHVDVAAAVVLLREDALGKYLAAYVVPVAHRDLDVPQVRRHLQTQIPEYMVPRVIVLMASLPTTLNGKIDPCALPLPTFDRFSTAASYIAPRDLLEAALTAIWAEILGVSGIGIGDNFFELGGDSLKAIRIAARATTTCWSISAADILRNPTVARLVDLHAQKSRAHPVALLPSPQPREGSESRPSTLQRPELPIGGASFPLTPMQKGLLFHAIADPEGSEYFQQVTCEIEGDLNQGVLEASWNALVGRHAALRASFSWRDLDEPVQHIRADACIRILHHDWRAVSHEVAELRYVDLLETDRANTFDLDRAPLMRVHIIRVSETRYRMIWSHHHLILDGWSIQLALIEVLRGYAFRLGNIDGLDATPAADFLEYLRYLSVRDARSDESFWREYLAGFALPTPLPFLQGTGTKFAAHFDAKHSTATTTVPGATFHALGEFCKSNQLTENVVFCGAWAMVLAMYGSNVDVIFGLTTSGRSAPIPQVDEIVGTLINTVPLRVKIDDDETVTSWLARLGSAVAELMTHEHASLIDIQQWSQISSEMPLFSSILVCEAEMPDLTQAVGNDALRVENLQILERTSFPLSLTAVSGAALRLELGYRSDLFSDQAARRILRRFESLLADMTGRGLCVRDLRNPTRDELTLLREWCGQARSTRDGTSVVELFRKQARRRPSACAVRHDDRSMTYGELEANSDSLARALRERGVNVEVRVGLMLEKSVELVAALLGVLKAGGAYCILDPSQPPAHHAASIEAAALDLVLTVDDMTGSVPLDDAADRETVSGSQLAYIVFTSGSSGRPKPVGVSHSSLLSAYFAWREVYGLEGRCRNHLQMANACFDVFTGDWVRALCSGGCLVLCSRETVMSPSELLRLVELHEIHMAEFVPAVLRNLVRYAVERRRSSTVPMFIVAGSDEWRDREFDSVRQVFPTARVVNSYGLSEATVDSTWYEGASAPRYSGTTIGRPLSNTEVYVLDDEFNVVPIGVTGELFIGGHGLARGYLGRPSLTAERFIPSPLDEAPGARLYRTGDRARFRADGNLEFLGRRDQQVKVRGHRIEPAEIEIAMLRYQGVTTAVVQLREDVPDDRYLAAYVVAAAGCDLDLGMLREHLQDQLPSYMVPQAIVALDTLPLTVNGKIDRSALPAPAFDRRAGQAHCAEPRNELETVLAAIWAEVLNLSLVGIHDNFFDLGGHSLKATRVVSHAADLLGIDVPIRTLFEHPTVSGFACELVRRHPRGDRLTETAAIVLQVANLSESELMSKGSA